MSEKISFLGLVSRWLHRVANELDRMAAKDGDASEEKAGVILGDYAAGMPNAQNAIDTLTGWNHALPDHLGVRAGAGVFYNDPRILWALQQIGSIEGYKILELGPLEASHTGLLERNGAAIIHAIEANKISFLRCLVVKELLGLKNAQFFLGDFVKWLQACRERYDFVVASGVLYHMQDPATVLEAISHLTDSFYLWTHYVSDVAMPTDDPRRQAFVGPIEIRNFRGLSLRYHKRSYHGAWRSKSFCGGMYDVHCWMEKDDILAVLSVLGFADIRVAHDEFAHPNGPAFSIFAQKPSISAR